MTEQMIRDYYGDPYGDATADELDWGLSETEKGTNEMTAREYLREVAGWKGDLAEGLFLLGSYLNRGNFFEKNPDANVPEDFLEDPAEPAELQRYLAVYEE